MQKIAEHNIIKTKIYGTILSATPIECTVITSIYREVRDVGQRNEKENQKKKEQSAKFEDENSGVGGYNTVGNFFRFFDGEVCNRTADRL